jgi:hypothetical protein
MKRWGFSSKKCKNRRSFFTEKVQHDTVPGSAMLRAVVVNAG